ncbi:MAG: hypothetical protein H0W99_07585 [Acidobacteria bacterium]|nr:hypothetical protein [Acidobacteriota bacterium]
MHQRVGGLTSRRKLILYGKSGGDRVVDYRERRDAEDRSFEKAARDILRPQRLKSEQEERAQLRKLRQAERKAAKLAARALRLAEVERRREDELAALLAAQALALEAQRDALLFPSPLLLNDDEEAILVLLLAA